MKKSYEEQTDDILKRNLRWAKMDKIFWPIRHVVWLARGIPYILVSLSYVWLFSADSTPLHLLLSALVSGALFWLIQYQRTNRSYLARWTKWHEKHEKRKEYFEPALLAYKEGRWMKAVDLFMYVPVDDDRYYLAQTYRANCYIKMKHYRLAVEYACKAFKWMPTTEPYCDEDEIGVIGQEELAVFLLAKLNKIVEET